MGKIDFQSAIGFSKEQGRYIGGRLPINETQRTVEIDGETIQLYCVGDKVRIDTYFPFEIHGVATIEGFNASHDPIPSVDEIRWGHAVTTGQSITQKELDAYIAMEIERGTSYSVTLSGGMQRWEVSFWDMLKLERVFE